MQPINMIMIYYWDKKLKKRLHVLEADMIRFKKKQQHWFDVSSSKDTFLQDVFEMTAIALLSVIMSYLPTPPLRQDMTKGQILSGV